MHVCVCTYVCKCVSVHVWMDGYMHGCMDAWIHACTYVPGVDGGAGKGHTGPGGVAHTQRAWLVGLVVEDAPAGLPGAGRVALRRVEADLRAEARRPVLMHEAALSGDGRQRRRSHCALVDTRLQEREK
jgi:hypothetical protein